MPRTLATQVVVPSRGSLVASLSNFIATEPTTVWSTVCLVPSTLISPRVKTLFCRILIGA